MVSQGLQLQETIRVQNIATVAGEQTVALEKQMLETSVEKKKFEDFLRLLTEAQDAVRRASLGACARGLRGFVDGVSYYHHSRDSFPTTTSRYEVISGGIMSIFQSICHR